MYNRPDRPLVVKCTLDGWHKRITFSSARNCTYGLLRHKVEQCFALSSTSYAIAYKDDDGEITNITNDPDLTEAIQYFQAGDDAPLSSAASILSGRSFGSRKVTLRVHITVDYDGPSLSDTGSLISLEDYKGRNGSQHSFSFDSPSVDLDDDSVTVSSRDNSGVSVAHPRSAGGQDRHNSASLGSSSKSPQSSWISVTHPATTTNNTSGGMIASSEDTIAQALNPFSDEHKLSAAERYPEDPSIIFERLKLQDSGDDRSSVQFESLSKNDRGVAWLRDQNQRTIRAMLGALPEPSESDEASLALPTQEELSGDLALERDPSGRYYYTYTSMGSSASQTHDSGYDEGPNGRQGSPNNGNRARPTSMQLDWLAAQQIRSDDRQVKSSISVPSLHTHHSDPLPSRELSFSAESSFHFIDRELLHSLPPPVPPPGTLTDCSECGTLLEAIRYVCSTCGEKLPTDDRIHMKGKDKDSLPGAYSYPPRFHHDPPFSLSHLHSTSSQTFIGSSETLYDSINSRAKPLPSVPSSSTLAVSGVPPTAGYELCNGCIESAGVHHAIEAGLSSGSSPGLSVLASPEDTQVASQWRRAAPKKGQLRHAYREKVWGNNGWEDVVQDEMQISKCSTCGAVTPRRRYKCVSCPNINLCRACYSQVHELHPSHAFLTVPDRPVRTSSEPDFLSPVQPDSNEEQSLRHPGVKCAHCLLDIVGARFHCAICDSVDICANCESAGLPGNLDSADGGHNSSHILIKIPYPLETTELQIASRRAIHLWTGGDAASVGLSVPRSRPSSVVSSYARTVVGSGARDSDALRDDHQLMCNGCGQKIIGIRYQCGNCSSLPRAYNLCSDCESHSYSVHDPMHVFFKLPRPVQHPIEFSFPLLPFLYKTPAGPASGTPTIDPKAYLTSLVHSSALCDRCMTCIQGEWFRCAYCARDLCDACEDVDTHDDTHVFLVFKSQVDMQTFRAFANLDSPNGSPPVIPYPVYR
ncbi:hypothetical protein L208DRAFT_1386173 [Tricholoma matsutake]|nr:hypothetical protein L208DRAFT_1386173 [Tricholoma matsutake 945]